MKYRIIKLAVTVIVLALAYAAAATAQTGTGTQTMPKAGMISDVKALKVGDIVTILINESSETENTNNTQTSSQNQLSAETDFGGSFLSNLTGAISSNTQNQYQGSGQKSSSGSFSTQLSASIIEVREDGNFLIRGSKTVETNGEKVVTVVEGVIRPADISRQNTILSTQIADVRMFHDSEGDTSSGSKPGLITRLLNWIF